MIYLPVFYYLIDKLLAINCVGLFILDCWVRLHNNKSFQPVVLCRPLNEERVQKVNPVRKVNSLSTLPAFSRHWLQHLEESLHRE